MWTPRHPSYTCEAWRAGTSATTGWSMDVRQNKADLGQAPVKSCCPARLMWKTSSAGQVLLEQKEGLENIQTQHKTAEGGGWIQRSRAYQCCCIALRLSSSCLEIAPKTVCMYTLHTNCLLKVPTRRMNLFSPPSQTSASGVFCCVNLVRRVAPPASSSSPQWLWEELGKKAAALSLRDLSGASKCNQHGIRSFVLCEPC